MTATLQDRVEIGAQKARDLAAQTVVLELRLGAPGFRRKIRSQDVLDAEDKVDPALLHVNKDLIDPAALKGLGAAQSAFRRWLANRTIACSMLRGGMWLVPVNLVEETDKGIGNFIIQRAEVVDALVKKYDEWKEQARVRLGRHFNETDYMAAEQLRAAFTVRARFLSFSVPAALEGLNKELYEREKQRVAAEWEEAGDEVRTALRESFAELIEHMADRLGTDEAGKPRTFRDSTVQQMQDFLSTFAARDLTNDAELASLAQQAKQVLKGIDPKKLRKQEGVRQRVQEGVAEIKAKLDTMVVAGKTRRFAKEDEV